MGWNALKIIPINRNDIFASNSYLIMSDDDLAIVDPSVSYDEIMIRYPEIEGKNNKTVLLTHGHMDHFYEIYSYTEKGFDVVVSKEDGKILSDPKKNCAIMLSADINGYDGAFREVSDGDLIKFGDNSIEVIATPGHTEGSVCYKIDTDIFTGDTLFASGGYGRFDLPTGNFVLLKRSLEYLLSLDLSFKIYPGHGEISTIEETKAFFY
jgi:glyoxylase-like metal-dependent hydrolase (beta-lactamase superfamily II)